MKLKVLFIFINPLGLSSEIISSPWN